MNVNYSPAHPLSVLSFLILGALIEADLRMPASVFGLLVTVIGIMHGFLNGIAMNGGPGVSGLFDIGDTLFILIAIASAFVVSLHASWTRVAVRVTGSWIAAVGVLMLGRLAKGNM